MLNLAYFQTRSSSGKIPKVRNTAVGQKWMWHTKKMKLVASEAQLSVVTWQHGDDWLPKLLPAVVALTWRDKGE